MRSVYIIGASVMATIAVAAAAERWIDNDALVSSMVFTDDQLDACAAEAEFNSYVKENHQRAPKDSLADIRENAAASMAVDGDYHHITQTARQYAGAYSLRTVYDDYLQDGRDICLKHRLAGEQITMPHFDAPRGYHVYRDMSGSAALVKDGDPNPKFDCIEGYHASGIPWQPGGFGGCVKD